MFFFERAGKAVALEAPCFYDNYAEPERYFAERGISVEAMLIAYHMCGGSFLTGVKKYATENAVEYGLRGGGKNLKDGFVSAFPTMMYAPGGSGADLLMQLSVCLPFGKIPRKRDLPRRLEKIRRRRGEGAGQIRLQGR